MSVYEKYFDVYSNWDLEKFKNIHHEDYMFVRETELLTRDEHVESFAELVNDLLGIGIGSRMYKCFMKMSMSCLQDGRIRAIL